MIIALIVGLILWMLFGRKALAWTIVIFALAWGMAVMFAPPIQSSPPCQDDYVSVPMKICPDVTRI